MSEQDFTFYIKATGFTVAFFSKQKKQKPEFSIFSP